MRTRASVLLLGLVLGLAAVAAHSNAQPREAPVRFGVVSFYNPRLMYLKYQPLVEYLTRRTGRSWELVLSPSYDATTRALCEGRLDVAYLGPYTYVRAHELCGAVPLVRLQTHGKATYLGLVMVRADSPITSLSQLRGKRFGFGAAFSTSSHLVPRAMLIGAGVDPNRDLQCRFYGHHERAARAVLVGEVDACSVRDIVGERFLSRGLKILARSEPIPNFPLVVGTRAPRSLRDELVRALVVLPRSDAEARAEIAGWDEELAGGFELASDADYSGIRDLALVTLGSRALLMSETDFSCLIRER